MGKKGTHGAPAQYTTTLDGVPVGRGATAPPPSARRVRTMGCGMALLHAIDISENLRRTVNMAISRDPRTAPVYAAVCFVLLVVDAVLCWVYDLASTYTATITFARTAWGALSDAPFDVQWGLYLAFFVAFVCVTPTLVEIGGAMFATAGVTPFQSMVYGMMLFDGMTDTQRVTLTIGGFFPALEGGIGILAYPVAYLICWPILLFLATVGFELAFVCLFFACCVFVISGIAYYVFGIDVSRSRTALA